MSWQNKFDIALRWLIEDYFDNITLRTFPQYSEQYMDMVDKGILTTDFEFTEWFKAMLNFTRSV